MGQKPPSDLVEPSLAAMEDDDGMVVVVVETETSVLLEPSPSSSLPLWGRGTMQQQQQYLGAEEEKGVVDGSPDQRDQQMQCVMTSCCFLPDQLKLHVLSFLSPMDLAGVLAINHHWRQIASS